MDLHVTRPGVVVPVRVDPHGLRGPTPGQARGPGWRTSSPGRFVPADVDPDAVPQRIVEAVSGLPRGAATGWAALHWSGARWFDGRRGAGGRLPVPVAVGDRTDLARRPGAVLWRDWLLDGDIVEVDGLPITCVERSVCAQALRARSLEDAVRVVAMAAADDLVSLAELAVYEARIHGRPHTRRLARAIAEADENLWSPQEVTLMVRWRGRRPRARLRCNPPVFDEAGRHLFTPDLLDVAAGVVGQYDGAVHETLPVRRRDLAVEELCRELGLQVVSMISTDLRDLTAFDARLDAAYRRSRTTRRRGGWTLEQPPWWVDTSTVAARRSLDAGQRGIWLRRARTQPEDSSSGAGVDDEFSG